MRISSDGKVHRSAEEWAEIFVRFDRSGLNRDQFCEKENIRAATFARWHTRIRAPKPRPVTPKPKTQAHATPAQFVEIASARSAIAPWSVELELPGGCVLRLRA